MQQTSVFAWHVQLAEQHGLVVVHERACAAAKVRDALALFGALSYNACYELVDGTNATVALFAEPADCATCYTTLRTLIDAAGTRSSSSADDDNDETRNGACASSSSLRQLLDVAWLHEDALDSFARKPYVVGKVRSNDGHSRDAASTACSSAAADASSSRDNNNNASDNDDDDKDGGGSGYLLVQWQRGRDAAAEAAVDHMDSAEVPAMQQALLAAAAASRVRQHFADDVDGGRLFLRFADDDAAEDFRRTAVQQWPALRTHMAHIDATAYALAHARRRS